MKGYLSKELTTGKFLDYWRKAGFHSVNPISITENNWTDSLYVNSGLIRYLDIINRLKNFPESLCTCQPCVKYGTIGLNIQEMTLRDGYFSFFQQLSCGAHKDVNISWFISKVVNFLTKELNLPINKFNIGVAKSQEKISVAWQNAGIDIQQIIFPDPDAYSLNLPDIGVFGIYSPFYFDRGVENPLSCRKSECNINCSCGRFLEIGDIGIINCQGINIIDHGIGLERLVSIANQCEKVADLPEFISSTKILHGITNDKKLDLVLADHFRTTFYLLSCGMLPGNKGRNYILRALLRRIYWQLYKTSAFEKLTDEMLFDLWNSFRDQIPLAKNQKLNVISKIKKELDKLQRLIKIGSREIIKYKRKNDILTPKFSRYLHETHGLPEEITQELFLNL